MAHSFLEHGKRPPLRHDIGFHIHLPPGRLALQPGM